MLAEEVATNGRNWSEIVSKHFPNRTSLAAKNRYSVLQRRRETSSEKSIPAPQELQPTLALPLDSSTPSISISMTGSETVSMDQYRRHSPTPSDFWQTNTGSMSEASTPTFVPDSDWNALNPAPSSLLSSSPVYGLNGSFSPTTYSSSASTIGLFDQCDFTNQYVGGNNATAYIGVLDGENMFDMTTTDNNDIQNASCQMMGSEFLYPYYGNWER